MVFKTKHQKHLLWRGSGRLGATFAHSWRERSFLPLREAGLVRKWQCAELGVEIGQSWLWIPELLLHLGHSPPHLWWTCFKNIFFFSKFYTQRGAQILNPEIKTCVLFWRSLAGTPVVNLYQAQDRNSIPTLSNAMRISICAVKHWAPAWHLPGALPLSTGAHGPLPRVLSRCLWLLLGRCPWVSLLTLKSQLSQNPSCLHVAHILMFNACTATHFPAN